MSTFPNSGAFVDREDLDGEALKAEVDKLADDASCGARARNSSAIMNVKGCIYMGMSENGIYPQ